MMYKLAGLVMATALTLCLTPSDARAYGAAHVGYTHVGPNGVYHEGATRTSNGGYNQRYGQSGGAYHYDTRSGGSSGYHYDTRYGGASGGSSGYHYDTHSSGTGGSYHYHYSYVR